MNGPSASSSMRSPPERGESSEGGQATVELVLVLPVVVLLVLVVVQVGIVTRDRVVLAHIAREAAREVAVDPRPEAAEQVAHRAGGLDPDRLSVSLSGSAPRNPQSGDRVVVTVGYRAPTDVLIVGRLVADLALATEITVRVE